VIIKEGPYVVKGFYVLIFHKLIFMKDIFLVVKMDPFLVTV
jgi:hypothetical protein